MKKIAECKEKNCYSLRLGIKDLKRIPPEVLEIDGLRELSLSRSAITDLSPFSGLHGLVRLDLGAGSCRPLPG